MLTRNLESVFCLPISKSQGEARNLDSAWRYLDLEICPAFQNPGRGAESGFWMARAGSWKLSSYPKSVASRGIWNLDGPSRVLGNSCRLPKSGQPPAPRPQLNGTVCPAPPGVFEPVPLLSFSLLLGNSESWKVETAITLPVVCTFPAREMPLQRCKAIAPGVRNGLARARVQRAPRAARHRVGARSHPRRTG